MALRLAMKRRPGFTLIELLIVAAVFSLLFLVGTTVFVSVQTRQRNILTRQRLTADGRYVLEAMARQLRLGTIDYTYYYGLNSQTGPTVPTNALAIRDQLNDTSCFFLLGSTLMQGDDCTTGTALTPDDLRVEAFDVYLHPRSNPYQSVPTQAGDCRTGNFTAIRGVCQCDDVIDSTNKCFPDQRCVNTTGAEFACQNAVAQPQATIVLRTQAADPGPGQSVIVTIQTTVTSRLYGQ